MNKTEQYNFLDVLRFFGFFWVFLGHNYHHHGILGKLQSMNWIGVDVFFGISSFLITHLLISEFKFTGRISFKKFAIRRILRIVPLYYLMLLMGIVLFPILNIGIGPIRGPNADWLVLKNNIIPSILFVQNISYALGSISPGNIIGPLWSISVEMSFYFLLVPLIILIIKSKHIYRNSLLLGVTAVVIQLAFAIFVTSNDLPQLVYGTLLGRLSSFIVGFFVAICLSHINEIKGVIRILISVILLINMILLLIWISTQGHPGYPGLMNNTVVLVSASLFVFSLLVFMLLVFRNIDYLLKETIVAKLGRISYGLYVFHTLGIYISQQIPNSSFGIVPTILSQIMVSMAITIGLSWISYELYEKRFLNLKRNFDHLTNHS